MLRESEAEGKTLIQNSKVLPPRGGIDLLQLSCSAPACFHRLTSDLPMMQPVRC